MATIRERLSANGLTVYQVVWKEPKRDAYGVPTGAYKQCGESFTNQASATARKTEVEEALRQQRLDPGEQRNLATKTLGQYAVQFFDALAGTIDPQTADKYRANYLLYVAPALGARAVASIRVADVKKLRSELSQTISQRTKRPLSAGTIKHAMTVLRMILDTAVENEALATNPAKVKLPSLRRQRDFAEGKSYTRLTVEQVATVADWIATDQTITVSPSNRSPYTTVKPGNAVYALAVLFSAFTGVRRAELQGLEIRDVTLSDLPGTAGQVTIARAKNPPNWQPQPLKTENAYRTIPLDPWLADDLRAYLLREHHHADNRCAPLFPGRLSRQAGKALGRHTTDSADMFDWTRPIDETMVYKRYWLPALKALQLPHSRWHDLRHSFAVTSLAGEHYRDVSRWLGHSKISTTLDIYASVIATEDGGKASPTSRPVPAPQKATDANNVVALDRNRKAN